MGLNWSQLKQHTTFTVIPNVVADSIALQFHIREASLQISVRTPATTRFIVVLFSSSLIRVINDSLLRNAASPHRMPYEGRINCLLMRD